MTSPFRLGFPRFSPAPKAYDQQGEAQFRLTVEQLLRALTSATNDTVNGSNNFTSSLTFTPDNTLDIGDSVTPLRPRNIFAGTRIESPLFSGTTASLTGAVTAGSLSVSGTGTFGGSIAANAGLVIAASQALTGTVASSTISGFLSVAATTGTFTNIGGTLTTVSQPNVTTMANLTTIGTLVAGAVPASLVTAGTFGAGAYTFPSSLAITGALTGVTTLTTSGAINGQTISSAANFTGTVTIGGNNLILSNAAALITMGANTGTSSVILMNSAAGALNIIRFQAAGVNRWGVFTQGSNEPLIVRAYDDAGTVIDNPLQITRAAGGAITLVRPLTTNQQITSTVGAGTAPFAPNSTTVCTNLNADLLDGQHGSYYNDAANLTGTVASARLSGSYTGITGVGTLTAGTWNGSVIAPAYLGSGSPSSANFLRGDGAWKNAPYMLQIASTLPSNLVDGETRYTGSGVGWTTDVTDGRLYIPKTGTITAAYIQGFAGLAAGSNENWSMYIRLNNTTDTLIATTGANTALREWTNSSLSIAVTAGDYIMVKSVNPTWATNPTSFRMWGTIVIE